MAYATDNFNRANEDPLSGGGNWVACGTQARPKIVGSEVVSNGAADGYSRYTGASWSADQQSEITLTASLGATNDRAGVLVRCPSGSNLQGYFFYVQREAGPTYTLYLFKWVGGSPTQLATTSYGATPTPGDVLLLEVVGDALTGKVNGTTKISTSDSAITAADPPGFFVGVNLSVDNWAGADAGQRIPAAGALALAGLAPTVAATFSAEPQAGALALAGHAPTVVEGLPGDSVFPGAGALALAGQAAEAVASVSVEPAAGALSLTASAPSATVSETRQPAAGALALAGQAADVLEPLAPLRDEWAVLRLYVSALSDSWTVVPTRFSSTLRDEWTVLQELAPLRDEWRVYPDKLPDLFAEPVHEPRALATVS